MIGKAIETIITTNTAINTLINGRVFPISDYDKGLPAIYYIVSCIPGYNKNGQQMQDWRVSLITMNKGYKDSWKLSYLLKEAFDHKLRRAVDGIQFIHIECESMTDDYEFQVQSFGQKLEFSIKTQTLKYSDI